MFDVGVGFRCSVLDFGVRYANPVFGIRLRCLVFGWERTGCCEGDGPLPVARRVDHRGPMVLAPALQVPGLPAHCQGGEAPACDTVAGLPRDTKGFGENGVFDRDGSYVLPVITRYVVGTYVTWIFRRNVPLFLVTVLPDTPQHQGGAPSKLKTPRHSHSTQHTCSTQQTQHTAHSKPHHER